ncbi:MAG: glycoside hydrolase family protein [Alphaproteobacteria bacterium]|nr:glycoside hydrolase family protein [Alphaproteobacteria bacterium]
MSAQGRVMWRTLGGLLAIIAGGLGYISEFGLPAIARDRLPPPAIAVVDAIEAIDLRNWIDRASALMPNREAPVDIASNAPSDGPHPGNANLTTNEAGRGIIMRFEGLSLEAFGEGDARYIGYGHRMAPGDPETITEADAERLLRQDLREIEDGVRRLLTRRANENQFSAMVSLAYTIGVPRFETASPVLVAFNAGDIEAAADAFRTHNRAGGEIAPFLVERRELERQLFLAPA